MQTLIACLLSKFLFLIEILKINTLILFVSILFKNLNIFKDI